MKAIFILLVGIISSVALADSQTTCTVNGKDVSADLEQIVTHVKAMKDCNQAADFASACAWGSSADVQIAGAAADICGAEMDKNGATKTDHALLTNMYDACNAKWSDKQGTMYISFNMFCQLEATKWMTNLTSAYQE